MVVGVGRQVGQDVFDLGGDLQRVGHAHPQVQPAIPKDGHRVPRRHGALANGDELFSGRLGLRLGPAEHAR